MPRFAARLSLLFLALALLASGVLASPTLETRDEKKDHHPDHHPDHKKHDDNEHKKPHHIPAKTAFVTVTATATASQTVTLIPTVIANNLLKCKVPSFKKHHDGVDGKKGDGIIFFFEDGKKGGYEEVELIFVKEFGGYIFKCDGVWIVFVVEKQTWFLIKLIPVCPPAPPKDSKKHGYLRRDAKKLDGKKKIVTLTQTATATVTATTVVEPPCIPAKCQLPQFHSSKKHDDDYWYIIDEKGKWQIVEVIVFKPLGAIIFICDGHIYVFIKEKNAWFEVILIPIAFPPKPPHTKPLPPPPTTKPLPPTTTAAPNVTTKKVVIVTNNVTTTVVVTETETQTVKVSPTSSVRPTSTSSGLTKTVAPSSSAAPSTGTTRSSSSASYVATSTMSG